MRVIDKKRSDKKASVPIGILVIGVLAVCSFAVVSFFLFNSKTDKVVEDLNLMNKINLQIEDYSKNIDLEQVDAVVENNKVVFSQERVETDGFLFFGKERSMFKVSYELGEQ